MNATSGGEWVAASNAVVPSKHCGRNVSELRRVVQQVGETLESASSISAGTPALGDLAQSLEQACRASARHPAPVAEGFQEGIALNCRLLGPEEALLRAAVGIPSPAQRLPSGRPTTSPMPMNP